MLWGADIELLLLIEMTTRPCQQWSGSVTGWLSSPVGTRCSTAGCHGCTSLLYVASRKPIQLRFHTFQLQSGEYIEIREGVKATGPLIGRFTSSHRPSRVIEVAGNKIFVVFNSSAVHRTGPAFNFTFQPKGALLAKPSKSLVCNCLSFLTEILCGQTKTTAGHCESTKIIVVLLR